MDPNRAEATTQLMVSGMTCHNCARHVMEAIQQVTGVASASVSLEENRALVRWLPAAQSDDDAVMRAVRQAGYQAQIADQAVLRESRSSWSPRRARRCRNRSAASARSSPCGR